MTQSDICNITIIDQTQGDSITAWRGAEISILTASRDSKVLHIHGFIVIHETGDVEPLLLEKDLASGASKPVGRMQFLADCLRLGM